VEVNRRMCDVGRIQHEHAGNQSGERSQGFGHIRRRGWDRDVATRQNLTPEGVSTSEHERAQVRTFSNGRRVIVRP
jgi:hypothetical protein